MSQLGTHAGCGGQVVFIQRAEHGYRLCVDCGRNRGDVVLVEELPVVKPTVKVTLSRKVRAFQYVSRLKLGHVIGLEEELQTEPFGIYLPQGLMHYGLDLERVIGGWKVVKRVEVE